MYSERETSVSLPDLTFFHFLVFGSSLIFFSASKYP